MRSNIWQSGFFLLLGVFVFSCSLPKHGLTSKQLDQLIEQSPVFSRYFSGFMLYDPEQSQVIYQKNADKYFVPASNTKLFTYYAGLNLLGDSVPALKYIVRQDSLIFWGTGDPSLLNPDQNSLAAYEFLRNRPEKLYFSPTNFYEQPWGDGWAWNWYNYAFASERSPLPLYGNYVRFRKQPGQAYPAIDPPVFSRYTRMRMNDLQDYPVERAMQENEFNYYLQPETAAFELLVPFKYSAQLTVDLLSDTLHRPVGLIYKALPPRHQTIYSQPADSVYQEMLQQSDNFLAEQIMLMCASAISDSLSVEIAIDYTRQNFLKDSPDEPIWIDGSGLSRYNMFTPRTMVYLLEKIGQKVPRERLFKILPAGGVSGTIRNWYAAEQPYVFAKTGTLYSVIALSGYLKTSSGKTLIFSWFHNNHNTTTDQIKQAMQEVLEAIRQAY
ncbi:MAG: D-alanyl-D-alanine carboxypeptidase/D-alanyl-D-alanine endopeptidase [Candidatus Cyclobacteriaceae bacterium M3_2C_046]